MGMTPQPQGIKLSTGVLPLPSGGKIRRVSPYLYEFVPEFHWYLQEYPRARLSGTEDFIYWSKEKFGLKPVVSLTHVTIYRRKQGSITNTLIASKGIYASHYFDASLGMTGFVHDEGDAGLPVPYLMYLNRSRADALKGGFSGLKRTIVESRARKGLEENMILMKERLESSYREQRGVGER